MWEKMDLREINMLCSSSKYMKSHCAMLADAFLLQKRVENRAHSLADFKAAKLLSENFGIDTFQPRLLNLLRPKALYDQIQRIFDVICSDQDPQFPLSETVVTNINHWFVQHHHRLPANMKKLCKLMRNRGYFNEHQLKYAEYSNASDSEKANHGTGTILEWTDIAGEKRLKDIQSYLRSYDNSEDFLSHCLRIFTNLTNIQEPPLLIVALLCSSVHVHVMRSMIASFALDLMKSSKR
jgi:hypothetical protein